MAEIQGSWVVIPFRCGRYENDTSLCFHPSATCATSPPLSIYGSQACRCPSDFRHDFTFSHLPNCALPYWFLPAFFAVSTVGMGWAVFYNLLPQLRTLKLKTKKISALFIASVCCQWLNVLSVFIQGGNFEPGIFFLLLQGILMTFTAHLVVVTLIEPMYAVMHRSPARFTFVIRSLFAILSAPTVAMQIAQMVHARDSDPAWFNMFCAIQLCALAIAYLVVSAIIFYHLGKMQGIIQGIRTDVAVDAGRGVDKLARFMKQLEALKHYVKRVVVNSLVVIMAILMFTLGSIPYQFVLWAINVSIIWPNSPKVARFLKGRDEQTSSPSVGKVASSEGGVVDEKDTPPCPSPQNMQALGSDVANAPKSADVRLVVGVMAGE